MNAAIHIHQATKYYGPPGLPAFSVKPSGLARNLFQPVLALDGLSLDVAEGEIFAIAGPSGSGKTTLLRLLAGLLRPDAGALRVFGYDTVRQLRQVQRLTNRVSVESSFFKGLSPLENLQGAARLLAPDEVDQASTLLSRLGMDDTSQRRPIESLRRDQQALVFIARAVLSRPRLLLLDEPFAGLDLFASYRVREVLADLRLQGVTILFTAADACDAAGLADRIALLDHGRLLCIEAAQPAGCLPLPIDLANTLKVS